MTGGIITMVEHHNRGRINEAPSRPGENTGGQAA